MYNISYVSEVCTSHARAQKCVRVYLFEYTLIESCQMKSRANKWQFAEQANARVSECERERERSRHWHTDRLACGAEQQTKKAIGPFRVNMVL